MFVIFDKETERLDLVNDDIREISLYVTRSHAVRVIRWLGLENKSVREATDDEVAAGRFITAHCTPNWQVGQTPQKILDQMEVAGISCH